MGKSYRVYRVYGQYLEVDYVDLEALSSVHAESQVPTAHNQLVIAGATRRLGAWKSRLVQWLLFGATFATLPFLFTYCAYRSLPKPLPPFYWYYLWPKGELLLVCLAFAADGIGEALELKEEYPTVRKVLVACCLADAAASMVVYGLLQGSGYNDDKLFITCSSLVLFLLTFVCSGLCKALPKVE